MSIIKKGTPFGGTEQVTSDKLNNLVDNASFTDTSANAVAYTGSTGTCLNGGGLEVTSAGQLQIKDADISTAKIADDAVTPAKTDFIDSTSVLTLTGTAPTLKFDDTNNVVTNKPFLSGNTTDGGIDIRTQEGSSNVRVQAVDKLLVRTTSSPSSDNTDVNNYADRLEASSTSGKDESGSATAGAKVTGGLYVTGDVYADDHVVADHILLQGDAPNINFSDSDVGTPYAYITGNGVDPNGQKLLMYAPKAGSDIATHSIDNFTVKVADDATSDYDETTNPYIERFKVAHDAGKDVSGTLSAGAKVSGDIQVTGDINVAGDGIITNSSSPKLTFADTGNSGDQPFVQSYSDGTIQMRSDTAGSNVVLDGKNQTILQYNDTSIFRVGSDVAKNESGSDVEGAQVTGSLEVTDHLYVTNAARLGTNSILGTDSILQASPSTSDDSTKIASTAFVKNLMDTFAPSVPSGDGITNSGSVTLPGGLIIKYGKNVDSTSKNAQVFSFPTEFPNNHFVTITNNAKANAEGVFPVTSIDDGSFTINRSDNLNNPQSFHFISIGN